MSLQIREMVLLVFQTPYIGYLHNGGDEEGESEEIIDSRFIKRDEYSKKAWDNYMDFKEEDARLY